MVCYIDALIDITEYLTIIRQRRSENALLLRNTVYLRKLNLTYNFKIVKKYLYTSICKRSFTTR